MTEYQFPPFGNDFNKNLTDIKLLLTLNSKEIRSKHGGPQKIEIPVLDGGHLVFFGYEAVTGRKPGVQAVTVLMVAGLALVLFMTFFALANDRLHVSLVTTDTKVQRPEIS